MTRLVVTMAIGVMLTAGVAGADTIWLSPGTQTKTVITRGASGFPSAITGTNTFNGVSRLFLEEGHSGSGYGCSGSLLWTGRDILTAAHCLVGFNLTGVYAQFWGAGGAYELRTGSEVIVHPDYVAGQVTNPNDLAIIRLDQQVQGAWERYDINGTGGEIGQVGTLVGYGWTGNGNSGATYWDGQRRSGQNLVDGYWSIGGSRVLSLMFDFDNGLAANNALARCYRPTFSNLGLGAAWEGMLAPGDSGGPMFIGGKVAGVNSWIGSCGMGGGDIDGVLDSSFGEFGGDTRVFEHYQWIDQQVVPEPGSLLLLATGGAGLAAMLRRRSA